MQRKQKIATTTTTKLQRERMSLCLLLVLLVTVVCQCLSCIHCLLVDSSRNQNKTTGHLVCSALGRFVTLLRNRTCLDPGGQIELYNLSLLFAPCVLMWQVGVEIVGNGFLGWYRDFSWFPRLSCIFRGLTNIHGRMDRACRRIWGANMLVEAINLIIDTMTKI